MILHKEFYEKCVGRRCTRGNLAFLVAGCCFPGRKHVRHVVDHQRRRNSLVSMHTRDHPLLPTLFSLFFDSMATNQFGFALVYFLPLYVFICTPFAV